MTRHKSHPPDRVISYIPGTLPRNYYAPGKVNPHLPHDGVEIEAPPPDDASDIETAHRNADLLVSQLMQSDAHENAASIPVKPLPQANASVRVPKSNDTPAPVVETVVESEPRMVATEARLPDPEPEPDPAGPCTAEMPVAEDVRSDPAEPVELRDETEVTDRLREAFPELADQEEPPSVLARIPPVYSVGLACGVIVFIWPTLLFWVLLTICVLVLSFAGLMKLPGVAKLFTAVWSRFVRRNPERAENVRKVADRLALGLERSLDLLPGSLADRLSLPDFSQPVSSKR